MPSKSASKKTRANTSPAKPRAAATYTAEGLRHLIAAVYQTSASLIANPDVSLPVYVEASCDKLEKAINSGTKFPLVLSRLASRTVVYGRDIAQNMRELQAEG